MNPLRDPPATVQPLAVAPFSDTELSQLELLLQAVPAPLQALDLSALDGFLCGVLLQPQRPPPSRWWPFVVDVEGRPLPASAQGEELLALVLRRHAELDRAITQRQWFDPWIFGLDAADTDPADVDHAHSELDDPAPAMQPWVAGFAAAMEHFPDLMAMTHADLVEPLALLFMHFNADDLEDADALLAVIETLEPPADLAEAVQDLVRALMLIADVTRPQNSSVGKSRPTRPTRRTARKRR